MSNLTLVMVWNWESTQAMVYVSGGTVNTFNDAITVGSAASPADRPIQFILPSIGSWVDLYRRRLKTDVNLRRLSRLADNEHVCSIEIVGDDGFAINLCAPLRDSAAFNLTTNLARLFSDADVASERQDHGFTRPAWAICQADAVR